MQAKSSLIRRISVLHSILQGTHRINGISVRLCSNATKVAIGTTQKETKLPQNLELVPKLYYVDNNSQSTLHILRWIMQKDLLGQDIFLIGQPGPRRRLLAMQYLELTNRELEYVALNRDTTEADLKQRKEIVHGSAVYFDQSAVRAAVNGRVLVLEGIEKVERNVLPVLNNLLENREMHLEDGRLLIPAERYDKLLQEHGKEELEKWKLVRVDENFRAIAIGLPIPRYAGNPLDPPLRSRFQAKDVSPNSFKECLEELKAAAENVPEKKLGTLLSAAFGISSAEGRNLGFPDFPIDNLVIAAKILEKNPGLDVYDVLYRLYPYKYFLKEAGTSVESLLAKFGVTPPPEDGKHIIPASLEYKIKEMFTKGGKGENFYVDVDYQSKLLKDMLATCEVSDFCLIGPRGCGKSLLVRKISEMLNQDTEMVVLYQDMTSRDLIQQRTTLENGDTVWRNSSLLSAALKGKIAVLDGIHRIHPSTLSVLFRLVQDRELQCHDGKRLIGAERYEALKSQTGFTDGELAQKGILKIHPNFRIVALSEPPTAQIKGNWLTSEVLSLFPFHAMRTLTQVEQTHIISTKYGSISKPLHQLVELANILRSSPDPTLSDLAGHLSLRQLLRIASRLSRFPVDNIYETIQSTFMVKFLPSIARQALENTIARMGIVPESPESSTKSVECTVSADGVLKLGQTTFRTKATDTPSKVPDVLFYDIPQHMELMERLLQDFILGSHLLLVGNQGVGKNKIIDRFLSLINQPREYIQLHRDTTVQTLTIQPNVKDGLLVYEDSPLVKAVKHGHVLVVDEADKAPVHVTCILKTLVETGSMSLSDGRTIVAADWPFEDGEDIIRTHPNFRMIVLANRPGFPFLGNDFFGALGDLFSCHAMDNPSKSSEMLLLRQYGPSVPEDVLGKLVGVFGELRAMADQGLVSYPYSTREVVNVVKHLEKFPDADILNVLFNVFDFDRYSPEVVQTLGEVLSKHGFAEDNIFTAEWLAARRAKEYLQVTVESKSGKDVSAPKHGKEDPKNEPHVGGNTWAGGTGGRDTAGLGGKGGPYRLDKGHKVHQLSQEEIDSVPDHVKEAAREMGRKAFEEKLKEIGMSGYDATVYEQFSSAVRRQVQSMRVILSSLQAKNKERYWSRHQTSGELDDVKLIDGLLGDKTVYRRRTEQNPEMGAPQMKPKRLRLVVDVSGSMYRFNSYDGRLDRELEAVVLVMEAFQGFEERIRYDIVGHSGDAHDLKFVDAKNPPADNKKRLDVIKLMHAHSQYCWSGDNTLPGTEFAVSSLAEEDCDEAIVVVLSDANLSRYNISAAKLAKCLMVDPKVNAFAIFIGGLGDQAERLRQSLPSGRAFICNDVSGLPQILKQIFSSSMIRT